MNEFKVVFLPHHQECTIKAGENLLRAAIESGVHINASCGGDSVCGKCRVIIEEGSVEGGISEKFTAEEIENGHRLACTSFVQSDVTIRVPVESSLDRSALKYQSTARKTARVKEIDLEKIKENGVFLPSTEKLYLELPKPNRENNQPDISRLLGHMKNVHDEHDLLLYLPVIRKIPVAFREGDFNVTVTLERTITGHGKNNLINIQPGDTTGTNYGLVVDIGTTTVYAQLVDLNTGDVIAEEGDFNGQISYGDDVISRLVFAEKSDGLEILHQTVIDTVNGLFKRLLKNKESYAENISVINMAGNTTMIQLLLKIESSSIRRDPYVPATSLFPPIRPSDLGLDLSDHVKVLVYPTVSSYVGGDIVAGVIASGIYLSDEVTVFIDIGTNAEIVVGNKDWLVCAACSAGPAFEGGEIEFGTRAIKGAIEDFSIDPVTLEPMLLTVGNQRPLGICGSGLITLVATFFEMGIIDNLGKFDQDLKTDRLRERDGVYEYVLAWKEETQIDRDIVITEIDIENLIRAKGAIYSGFTTLLQEVGLSVTDIQRIILAGGFGSYVDLEKAMIIGLLPEMEADKIEYIGNGSLIGVKMGTLANRIRKDVMRVEQMMSNMELSITHSYMDNYVASLFLPHTDIDLFPKLKARIEERKSVKEIQAEAAQLKK